MNKTSKGLLALASSLLIMTSLTTSVALAETTESDLEQSIAAGKKLAFDRPKGNCLACHMIKDGASPGNIAPPLIVMKTRFPDKKVLKSQIWDASKRNPETSMPLFGRYEILSESELDDLVNFIHSL